MLMWVGGFMIGVGLTLLVGLGYVMWKFKDVLK